MDISFVSKIYEETDELKKIFAGTITEYAITHTPDKEVSRNHSELLSCASTFGVILYVGSVFVDTLRGLPCQNRYFHITRRVQIF